MKKIILVLLALLPLVFYSCASSQLATEEEMKHEYIYTFDSLNKEIIFDKSMKYISNNFKSAKNVIDYSDKQAGSIVAKGIIPDVDFGGIMNGNLGFTLNISIRDYKMKLDYNNIMPMTKDYIEFPSKSNYQRIHLAAEKEFNIMSKNIYDFIIKKEDF